MTATRVKRQFIRTRQHMLTDGGIAFDIGMRTKNESNQLAPNWMVIAGTRKRQRMTVMTLLSEWKPPLLVREVTFIRYAPSSGLDDDGLRSAMKSVRDQALCWLQGNNTLKAKANDGPECGLKFNYEQFRSAEYGVRVVFK